MRLLHTVEFYHPSVGGMQEVVRQISERLVRLGHEVVVATTNIPERTSNVINGVKIEGFDIKGNYVFGLKGDIVGYRRFIEKSDFDLMTNFAAQQWATDAVITQLEKIPYPKVFVPTGFSGYHWPAYRSYFKKMQKWMHQYDMNVFLSNTYQDIEFARAHGVERICIIPNGAGKDEFLENSKIDFRKRFNIPPDSFFILHVGSHTGLKGHAESIEIFRRADISNAVLVIIGNKPDGGGGCIKTCLKTAQRLNKGTRFISKNKRIIILSPTRKETVAAYQAADLFLFPSNIECSPIVLFESMASRTPFLTTDVGNSKEIIKWSNGGVLMPTNKYSTGGGYFGKFKRMAIRILTWLGIVRFFKDLNIPVAKIADSTKLLEELFIDEKKRSVFAQNGFRAWSERFTWEIITEQYEKLYFSLIDEKK